MHLHDGDIPEILDPRLEAVDRLLARDAAQMMNRAPAGLADRVHVASVALLPRPGGRTLAIAGSSIESHWRFGFPVALGRRWALAACMGLVFLGGMWAVRQEQPTLAPLVDPGSQIVLLDQSEGLSAFLTPIGDDEIADDRAGISVIELGDAEFWAIEAELAALESVLQLR